MIRRLFQRLSNDPELAAMAVPVDPSDLGGGPRAQAESLSLYWKDALGESQTAEALVEDMSGGCYSLLAAEGLAKGQTILVGHADSSLKKAVVQTCSQNADSTWRIRAHVIDAERRRAERMNVRGEGEIRWMAESGHEKTSPATVVNISESGAQVRTAEQLRLRHPVSLTGSRIKCQAVVCYSNEVDGVYVSGLHFVQEPRELDS